MPLLKKRDRRGAEIPTSSMADIAFLLLIFFLVTTTINAESGIYMQLPPPLEEVEPPKLKDRNLLNVLVANNGDVLVEGEFMRIENIRDEVVTHITNEGRDDAYSENPDKAVVSFKTEQDLSYARYIDVLDEIKSAYVEVRNNYAQQVAGVDYATYKSRLGEDEEDAVVEKYPLKISLAEPTASSGAASN